MIFALLAKFLTHSPPLVQTIVVGLCTGLFISAATSANDRKVVLNEVVVQVVVVAVAAGAMFYLGLRARRREPGAEDVEPWVYGVYAVVWLGALGAGVAALLGAGGFKVAAMTIVPLVLLAPPAFVAFRAVLHRAPRGADH